MPSKVFWLLALGGLALAAPARAGVYQASTVVPLFEDTGGDLVTTQFDLPQYSGPGAIIGVNIAVSGSGVAGDDFPYGLSEGITVAPYDGSWGVAVGGPGQVSSSFLNFDTVAHYPGGSVPPCTDPGCEGGLGYLSVVSAPTAFSGNANPTDLGDFAGGGTNDFQFVLSMSGNYASYFNGSAKVTETITYAVPEASTWTMALIGFAMVGFAVHGRRGRKPADELMLRPALGFAWTRRAGQDRAS